VYVAKEGKKKWGEKGAGEVWTGLGSKINPGYRLSGRKKKKPNETKTHTKNQKKKQKRKEPQKKQKHGWSMVVRESGLLVIRSKGVDIFAKSSIPCSRGFVGVLAVDEGWMGKRL